MSALNQSAEPKGRDWNVGAVEGRGKGKEVGRLVA